MKNLYATFIMTAISLNPAIAIEQNPTAQAMQRYVFSYDFVNQQDPLKRHYEHLSQEINYQVVVAVQQASQANLRQVGSDLEQFNDSQEQQVTVLASR